MLQWGLSLWKTFFSPGAASSLVEMDIDLLESRQADRAIKIRPVGTTKPAWRLNWRTHLLDGKEIPVKKKQKKTEIM